MHIKDHSEELVRALHPVHLFLKVIAQMPFQIVKNSDGTYSFHFRMTSLPAIAFVLNALIFGILFLGITIGTLCIIFEVQQSTYFIDTKSSFGVEEKVRWDVAIFSNHWVLVFIFYCWMFQCLLGSYFIYTNAKEYVHYLNYWNRVVQVMDMDTTSGIYFHIRRELITLGTVSCVFSVLFTFVGPVRAICGLIACLILKIPVKDTAAQSWFFYGQVFGFLIIVYGYIGSRAVVLQFVLFSEMLANGASMWNKRLKMAIDRAASADGYKDKEYRNTTRLSYKLILKDHYIIVQLFKSTEAIFGNIVKLYYLLQVTCLVFEMLDVYFLLGPVQVKIERFRNTSWSVHVPILDKLRETSFPMIPNVLVEEIDENAKHARNELITQCILILVLLVQSAVSCFTTTLYANAAHDEGVKGFQMLRRRGLLFCTTKTERNFMHSLIISFGRNNPVLLSAGGYFNINKSLILAVLGTVCAYFIIMIQLVYTTYEVQEQDYRLELGLPKSGMVSNGETFTNN